MTNRERAISIVAHINDVNVEVAFRSHSHAVNHITDLLEAAEKRGMKTARALCFVHAETEQDAHRKDLCIELANRIEEYAREQRNKQNQS